MFRVQRAVCNLGSPEGHNTIAPHARKGFRGEKEGVLWGPTELKMVTAGLGEHRDEVRVCTQGLASWSQQT